MKIQNKKPFDETSEINPINIEKKYKIYNIENSQIIGSILQNNQCRQIYNYLIEKEYYNEELARLVYKRYARSSNIFFHLQKFRKCELATTVTRKHAYRNVHMICYKAPPVIIIVRRELESKFKSSKRLENLINKLVGEDGFI